MTLPLDQRERESVLCDLESADEDVRRLAVERIEALADEEAVQQLIACLGDSDWRVRRVAAERLAARSDRDATIEQLIAALGDAENTGRRNGAVDALVRCGLDSVPALVAALDIDDADVRKFAVDTLAAIGDVGALATLIQRLEDADANVRAAAVDAIGALGSHEGCDALYRVAALDDEDLLVRFSALRALSALDHSVAPEAVAGALSNPMLRAPALALLGSSREAGAVPLLLKALTETSRANREASIRSLLDILARSDFDEAAALEREIREAAAASDELVPAALERLTDADLPTRLMLIQFLGLAAREGCALPILRAGLDQALEEVCGATLESMGATAEAEIDGAFASLDTEHRAAACRVFGRLSGKRGGLRLLESLAAPDPQERIEAARAVGRRRLVDGLAPLVRRLAKAALETELEGDEELAGVSEALTLLAGPGADPGVTDSAVRLLSKRITDEACAVRFAAARVLGAIARPQDEPIVTTLLRDPEAQVRRSGIHALARLGSSAAGEPLRLALGDDTPSVRVAAVMAIGACVEDAGVLDLLHLAADDDVQVRAAVVRSVTRRFRCSGDAALRELSTDLLDKAFADAAPVALAAAESLREIGGTAARDAIRLLDRSEPEVALEAVRCLGSTADPGSFEALFPLVAHPDWSVRAEVIQTLARRRTPRSIPPILRRLEVEQDEFVREVILQALKRLEG